MMMSPMPLCIMNSLDCTTVLSPGLRTIEPMGGECYGILVKKRTGQTFIL
jgi:hypothetical protein